MVLLIKPPMEKPITKSGILLIILASLAGLFLSIYATNSAVNAYKSKNWPTVEGTIITSEVVRHSKYVPQVIYNYSVDTIVFSSEKISLTPTAQYKYKDDAAKITDKYPVNTKVKVYYDPNRFDFALLEPGIKGVHIFMFLLGLVIFVAPLIGLRYSLKKSQKTGNGGENLG